MGTVFLGWAPSGEAIKADFDPKVSRLIDVGRCKAIIPRAARSIGARWNACWHPSSQTFYVQRPIRDSAGKPTGTEYLHRVLKGLMMGDKREIDHKDNVGLNNANSNLAIVTKTEHHRITRQRRPVDWTRGMGAAWAKKRAATSTGHYGVSKHRQGFSANATIPGHPMKYLGKFDDAVSAAHAVNVYLLQFDQNDPRLNRDLNGVLL